MYLVDRMIRKYINTHTHTYIYIYYSNKKRKHYSDIRLMIHTGEGMTMMKLIIFIIGTG